MQLNTISLDKTGKFSKLILDYVNNSDALSEFISEKVTLENFKSKLIEKNLSKDKRELLVKRLTVQYEDLGFEIADNIPLLANDNAYAVTTGHQLCLMGGPQYFIHKIISTIKLSIQLKKAFPDNEFIPIFWLASEDHDFDEINEVKFFRSKLKIDDSYSGPVGRLDADIFQSVVHQLNEILGDSINELEIKDLFTRAYQAGSLSDATSRWVNELFKSFGLVILDADDIELKRSFSAIIKDELVNRNSCDLISKTSSRLKELGYNAQVHPREINLFYIDNNSRERIVFENNKYVVLNTDLSFSENQILDILDTNPERFSPNVVMRPVYEESILPNIAYIGGPGEIAYWLQLKSNFDRLKIAFPLLILRDSFVMLNSKQVSGFNDLGFKLEDVFKPEHTLVKNFLRSNSKGDMSFQKEEDIINNLKSELLQKVVGIDNSLAGMINAEMTKMNKLIEKLESRIIKAQKSKQEVSVNKILKFREAVLPNDSLVERQESFIPNYVKYGDEYINHLIKYSDVFNSKLKILT